ncbi:hypothetical protein CISIN_1g0483972mg, partial [Citrus sinensis]
MYAASGRGLLKKQQLAAASKYSKISFSFIFDCIEQRLKIEGEKNRFRVLSVTSTWRNEGELQFH